MYGGQYRYLANLRRFRLFAYGAMPVVLEPAGQFGHDGGKILGGSLTVFLPLTLPCASLPGANYFSAKSWQNGIWFRLECGLPHFSLLSLAGPRAHSKRMYG